MKCKQSRFFTAKPWKMTLAMAAAVSLGQASSAQMPPSGWDKMPQRADIGKSRVESSVKEVIRTGGAPLLPNEPRSDISKMAIELNVKTLFRPKAIDVYRTYEKRVNRPGTFMSARAAMFPGASPLRSGNQQKSKFSVDRGASHAVASSNSVSTGLVTWHRDMKDAMAQSTKSGKPLLVFHMMGSLDDPFC